MAATKIMKKKGLARKKGPKTNHRSAKRIAPRTIIRPEETIPSLRKHMLIDGFDIVVDLKRSKGSYIVDAKDGKRYLDFFTFVASFKGQGGDEVLLSVPNAAGPVEYPTSEAAGFAKANVVASLSFDLTNL